MVAACNKAVTAYGTATVAATTLVQVKVTWKTAPTVATTHNSATISGASG
jgi:hypothetical protein